MSFVSVTVAGSSASVCYANNVAQSRLSMDFVERHIPRKCGALHADIVLTASSKSMCFTCVLDFVFDSSLSCCDAILGLDWRRQCENIGMQHLVQDLKEIDGAPRSFFLCHLFLFNCFREVDYPLSILPSVTAYPSGM